MTQVSNDKLMEMLIAIKGDVGEVKGQNRTFIDQMKVQDERTAALKAEVDTKLSGHDTRLRGVEGKQYWLSGAGAVVGMVLGALGLPHIKT